MADDPTPPSRQLRRGCGVWFAAVFFSVFIGIGLLALAMQANAPFGLAAAALFGPSTLVAILGGAIMIPRLVREFREYRRNIPSPESVAAAAAGAGVEAAPLHDIPDHAPPLAAMPAVPEVPTAPGLVLSHRLERADMTPACQFGCAVFAALFWNGIVSIFLWRLIADWNKMGGFKWFNAAFLVPFVLVGIVLILAVLGSALKWFVSSLIGRIEVEVSTHPLVPSGSSRIHVAQRGPVPLKRVELRLICTEAATYIAGTSTATATKEVVRHLIADPDENPTGGLPLEIDFTVPADAMHSFEASNNKIIWTLRVTARFFGFALRDDYRLAVVAPT
jgi:hypothetical protein